MDEIEKPIEAEDDVSAVAEATETERPASIYDAVEALVDMSRDEDVVAAAETSENGEPATGATASKPAAGTTDKAPAKVEAAGVATEDTDEDVEAPTEDEIAAIEKPAVRRWLRRAYRKEQEAVQRATTFEKEAGYWREHVGFIQQEGVTPEEHDAVWDVVAAMKRGNAKLAMQLLAPHIERLQLATGDRLPHDIQAAVDDGRIDMDHARELTRARSEAEIQAARARELAQRTEAANRQTAEVQHRQVQDQVVSTLQSWVQTQMEADVDFRTKAAHVHREMSMLYQTRGEPRSPAEALAYAREAKKTVDDIFASANPQVKPTRSTLSSASNQTSVAQPKPRNVYEAAEMALRQTR